jgi:hypothetical protein
MKWVNGLSKIEAALAYAALGWRLFRPAAISAAGTMDMQWIPRTCRKDISWT